MVILVTGGTGFIGSHLVGRLVEAGEQVRVLGTLSRELPHVLQVHHRSVDFHRGDVRDLAAVGNAMKSVNTVFHLSGVGSPASDRKTYRELLDVNLIGTKNVLRGAVYAGASRVVFASSAAVYGSSPVAKKTEDMRVEARSVYAVSKVASEQLCSAFYERFGLETVVLRYFNVYGPGQDRDGSSPQVVPSFTRALRDGSPLTLYGDGSQTRDFVYIDDVISGTVEAGRSRHSVGATLNIASGVPTSISEMIEALARAMNVEANVRRVPARDHEVKESVGSIDLAERLIGYNPRVSVATGVQMTVAAMRNELRVK